MTDIDRDPNRPIPEATLEEFLADSAPRSAQAIDSPPVSEAEPGADEATRAMADGGREPFEADLSELSGEELLAELNEALDGIVDEETVEDLEAELGLEPREDVTMMLDEAAEDRFLHCYAHLLWYVNDRFDVLPDIETVEELEHRNLEELQPIRERLYDEDTESLIESFVADDPTGLSESDRERVARWTDYEYGEFVIVRHLEEHSVFLDWSDPPRAFGVKALRSPFPFVWPDERLPVMLSHVALLPFEDVIVTDGWLMEKPIYFGGNISTSLDDDYEEAKHRFGIVESLPPPDESEKSDAEQLRFYLKNQRNRDMYAQEIQQLKDETPELERIYHQELGKARARSLGRELRDTDLQEAYFGIYDDRIVASGTSEEQLRTVLDGIMPEGKEDFPYVYHYEP